MPCCHDGTENDGVSCIVCQENFPHEYNVCKKAWSSFNKTLSLYSEIGFTQKEQHDLSYAMLEKHYNRASKTKKCHSCFCEKELTPITNGLKCEICGWIIQKKDRVIVSFECNRCHYNSEHTFECQVCGKEFCEDCMNDTLCIDCYEDQKKNNPEFTG